MILASQWKNMDFEENQNKLAEKNKIIKMHIKIIYILF